MPKAKQRTKRKEPETPAPSEAAPAVDAPEEPTTAKPEPQEAAQEPSPEESPTGASEEPTPEPDDTPEAPAPAPAPRPAVLTTESPLLAPAFSIEVEPPGPEANARPPQIHRGTQLGGYTHRVVNSKVRFRPSKTRITFAPRQVYEIDFDGQGYGQVPTVVADHLRANGGPIKVLE